MEENNSNDSRYKRGRFQGWTESEVANLRNDVEQIKKQVKDNATVFSKKFDTLNGKIDPIVAWRNRMIGISWAGSAILNIPAIVFLFIKILDAMK